MNKIGRNDPCSCGSGKKYKQCCGKSNVIPFRALHLDAELEKIHHELIEFAVTHYEREIDEFIQEYIEMNIMNEESSDIETYANLLIAWIIIHEPIVDNKTVLEIFLEQTINKVKNVRLQRAFSNWHQAISAIFKITSVEQKNDDIIIGKNIFTGKMHEIKHETLQTLHVGDYMMGTLAPFIHNEQFIFVVSLIDADSKGALDNLLEIYDVETEPMTELFPEWLGDLIDPNEDELTWIDIEHKRVADLIIHHLLEEDINPDIIDSTLYFWNVYCLRNNPYVPKPNTYVAGLYYLVMNILLDNRAVTQAKVAEKFNVSSTTVSKRYQDFATEYENIHMEFESESEFSDEHDINPLEQERLLASVYNELNKYEFESEEEIEQFLQNINLDDLMNDTEAMKVHDLIVQASETWGDERKQLVDKIFELDPNNVDGYILLADMVTNRTIKFQYLERAVFFGEQKLGTQFFDENKGYFWGLIETRPYMRAAAKFANLLHKMGQEQEAIKLFERLIELNPNDNQGIRDDLMTIYIETKAYEDGLKLYEQYSKYPETYLLYSRALIEVLQHGHSQEAKRWITKAIESNKYVVDYLTGRKQIPSEEPYNFQRGADSEAVIYVQRNFHLWEDNASIFQNL